MKGHPANANAMTRASGDNIGPFDDPNQFARLGERRRAMPGIGQAVQRRRRADLVHRRPAYQAFWTSLRSPCGQPGPRRRSRLASRPDKPVKGFNIIARCSKRRTEMKRLVTILIVVSALSFWGGVETAKAVQELSCGTTSCTFNEEIGPLQTKHYHGHCYGTGNTVVTTGNSYMYCNTNKANYVNCTKPEWNIYKKDLYWACSCENDSFDQEHPDFKITCPPPS